MACRTPGDPQLIYGEIDVSLSSVAIDRLKNANKSFTEEHDTNLSSEESHIGSEGEEAVGVEQRTFLVIVNDDGSFTLGNSNVVVESGDSNTVIPVTLPVNKMKSIEQPLPGARTLPSAGRSRKAKLQTRTVFGSESDSGYEFVSPSNNPGSSGNIPVVDLESTVSPLDIHIPSARGVLVSGTIPLEAVTAEIQSPTPASVIVSNPGTNTPSIDLTDFTKQLDPQSLANLENVLQSEQAREILETLTFDEEDSGVQGVVKTGSTQPFLDHSYSQSISSPSSRTVIAGPSISSASVIVPVQSVIQTNAVNSNSSSTNSTIRRNSTSNSGSSAPAMSPVVNIASTPKVRPNTSAPSTPGNGRRISEAESNANIRRSQRQQDRIERQEAERIMAENQQMLQREKEIMKEAKSGSAVSSPVNSPVPSVQHSPFSESPTAVVVASTPVAPPAPPTPTISNVTLNESNSTPASESGRPKRQNRKLPAHLADPNYVHFDEEVKVGRDNSKNQDTEPEDDDIQEVEDDPSATEGDDEDVTEDDPNRLWCICRQPHNNRFMICCDRCEEWFHGKCVGVTKAQGKAMELKKVLWHCPNCKKELKPQKTNQKVTPTARRNSDVPQSTEQKQPAVRKPGRPPKNKEIPTTPVLPKSPEILSDTTPTKQIRRKSEVSLVRSESVTEKSNKCMVCGRGARKDSAYCSDKCVQKWADTVGSKAVAAIAVKPTAQSSNVHNNASASAGPPNSPTGTPVSSLSPNFKLKRANSLKQAEPEKAQPFLTFHVISSGSTKSTETVPPRPKELTASAIVKQNQMLQQQQQIVTPQVKSPTTPVSQSTPTPLPTVTGISPNSVNAIMNSKPTVVIQNICDSQSKLQTKYFKGSALKLDLGLTQNQNLSQNKKGGQTPPTPVTPVGAKRSRTSSESSSNKTQKVTPITKKVEKDTVKAKETERDGPTSEKLLRENIKKSIREILKSRLNEVSESEKKTLENSGNTPESVAEKIEEELCKYYGGASNPKCKIKYRSIYFNFRDLKNSLFKEILSGNIKPKVLVRMEPQQMASAELAEWRLKENQKELEAIKRAELDKLAEAKKQQLIDSGVDDAVVVAEETRPKDITDVIDSEKEKTGDRDKKEKKDGSHSHSSHRRDKDKRSKNKDDKRRESKDHSSKDRDRRDRDKDKDSHRRSSRHRHRSSEKSKDKEKEKRSKEKGDSKESSRSSKSESNNDVSRLKSKDMESDKVKDKKEEANKTESKIDETSNSLSGEDSTPQQTTPTENTKSDARHSTDSEQEQPSSTIKTPDFVEDGSAHAVQFALLNGVGSKPIFKSSLTMQELGTVAVSVYDVSHIGLEGTLFPEAPVPFVGRISPETVWDYINKMKKTKEVIIFRLAPATPADTTIYNSFYDYLSARSRLGVLGSINHPLKDVYLCPLDKHTPMNRSLLPFRGGPGIPKERTNCLLAIVTRHIVDLHHQIPNAKRKGSVSSEIGKKKLKVEVSKSSQKSTSGSEVNSDARKLIGDSKKEESVSVDMDSSDFTVGKLDGTGDSKDDDDEPYTPWEEDDNEVETKPAPIIAPIKPDTQKLLEELNAKIEKERQEIELLNAAKSEKDKQEMESIAGAISSRQSMTSIPGLDGDFPESPLRSVVAKSAAVDQVPFFLRSNKDLSVTPTKSSLSQSVTIPGLDMETDSFPSQQSTKEIIDICEDDYDDEPVEVEVQNQTYAADPRRAPKKSLPIEPVCSKPIETIPGLTGDAIDSADMEAYSPSAVEFSDEEDKKEESISQDTTLEDDEEPLPPGVEKESHDVLLSTPTKQIKLEDPRLTLTISNESSPKKSLTTALVDLVEDSEPPPPGEIPSVPSTPIKITLPKVFETPPNEPPFPMLVGLQKTPQKVKININLSTKSLPPTADKQESSKETSPQRTISRQTPNVDPLKQSPTKPMPQLQLRAPLPSMPKLHQPPPCIPGLQKAPIPPTMSVPIQIPPPTMQNISIPVPVQIPPPNLQTGPPPPRISLGINVNVPPPPLSGIGIIPQIPGMMPRGLPPLTPGGIRFPPPTSIPPPPTTLPPPPTSIPPPPIIPDGSRNPAPAIIGGVRRQFLPPIPNPLAKSSPRNSGPPDLVAIDNVPVGPRTNVPENHNEHGMRGRGRDSRFDRNSRDRDVEDRRRGYQPAERGRNFRRNNFDNRPRRRSRSDDRSTRSRSRERRRRRGGRSRSRSPPAWRHRGMSKRSRSRSPRSNRRSLRTRSRSRSHSPHDLKSPVSNRQSNHRRSSKSKDKSRSRSRSPKRSYSRRSKSRSRSNSKSRSPSNSSRSKQRFSSETDRSPQHGNKSPIIGSREEDWEDDPDPAEENRHFSKLDDDSEKEPTIEFQKEKVAGVGIHLSPDIVQTH